MKKDKYVTEKYLDKRLDEKFRENNQILIGAIEVILDKRLSELKEELKKDINNVQTLIDAYVKAQEDFRQEFIIMKEELKRVKEALKKKLGVEI
jgi:enoyl-[acyl-carrier-protein] reductase (NADH)